MYDVLDRYYQAARLYAADVVVRITADCPVIDPGVIDETVRALFGGQGRGAPVYDFSANRLPPPWKRTYPIGLDTEVVTFTALETAWKEAAQPHQREHVMPFFYEQPERFRTRLVDYSRDLGALRWTVDTAEDLALARRIYAHFGGRDDFSWLDVLSAGREPARPGADQRRGAAQRLPPDRPPPLGNALQTMPFLTIFTAPKPFTDPRIDIIQRNAIRSWLSLGEDVGVILVGR